MHINMTTSVSALSSEAMWASSQEAALPAVYDAPVSHPADYIALLKPKVMTLVVFSGLTGMVLAPGAEHVHPLILFASLLSIAAGAGAAGAINMWYDRDIDAVMTRTRTRPIPAGKVSAEEALSFGLVTAAFSVLTLWMAAGVLPALLLAFSIFFYAVVYTMWLKRSTPQNIVIGGAAGAFPPVIGWAAVTGSIDFVPLALFALIFFWTPPHFWALSLFIKDEYAKVSVPMMPVVRGVLATKWQMLVYTVILLPVSVLPTVLGAVGWVYGTAAIVFSLLFMASAVQTLRSVDMGPARRMFGFSILYLFVLLALMIVDRV